MLLLFLFLQPDCPSCPANAIQIGHGTWAIWAAVKKCRLASTTSNNSRQFLNKTYWSNGCYAVVDLLSWRQLVLLTGSDIICKLLYGTSSNANMLMAQQSLAKLEDSLREVALCLFCVCFCYC